MAPNLVNIRYPTADVPLHPYDRVKIVENIESVSVKEDIISAKKAIVEESKSVIPRLIAIGVVAGAVV